MFLKMDSLPFREDLFNLNNNRNVNNTPRSLFNCGGYALGTFSWYCPYEENEGTFWWGNEIQELYSDTRVCINHMLNDFADLRIIAGLEELDSTEYAIAFRLSSDGDFHYIRRDDSGHWHHKRGATPEIRTMSTLEVFTTCWCDRYDGPVALLAKRKTPLF